MSWLEKDGVKKSEPHIDKIFKGTFLEDDKEIDNALNTIKMNQGHE